MSRSKSKRWAKRQDKDNFVRQARNQGFRSRAAFKLQAIDEKDKLLFPGMTVIELGAAPGGWSQYLSKRLGKGGRIIAVDLLDMQPVNGVNFICGDFTDTHCRQQLAAQLGGGKADLVLSDMAPNITGNRSVDDAGFAALFEAILDFSAEMLKPKGKLLVKYFTGAAAGDFRAECKRRFSSVQVRKPAASRTHSSESYLLAQGYYEDRVNL